MGLYSSKRKIQNAEDANATKVMFFLDTNDNINNKEKLLGESMKACNGESLWVYNDGKFTEDDFQNILNVGGATKKEKKDKIGSFGIGFNSVYHLTDVPSIVSGKSFVYIQIKNLSSFYLTILHSPVC